MTTQAAMETTMRDDARDLDAKAIRDTLAGKTDAYAGLIERYAGVVRRIARLALGSESETDDIVQSVFLKAYDALDTFDTERDFGAWTLAIARNQVRDALRKRAVEARHIAAYYEYVEKRFAEPSAADARDERLVAALKDCRSRLPETSALALTMRYEDGLPFESVAVAIGRTTSAARQLLTRVRAALKHCINERIRS